MKLESAQAGEYQLSAALVTPSPSESLNENSVGESHATELPLSYGQPLLVVIARDPKTLFAYWDIDWPLTFGDAPPPDRKVWLRVLREDGTEESRSSVEPLAGHAYLEVAVPDARYFLELGYEQSVSQWNSVITSEPAITPGAQSHSDGEFQIATIPLHLSFQRLLDTFRCPQFDCDGLSSAIAAQQRASDGELVSERLSPVNLANAEAGVLARAEFRAQATHPEVLRRQLARAIAQQDNWGGSSTGS